MSTALTIFASMREFESGVSAAVSFFQRHLLDSSRLKVVYVETNLRLKLGTVPGIFSIQSQHSALGLAILAPLPELGGSASARPAVRLCQFYSVPSDVESHKAFYVRLRLRFDFGAVTGIFDSEGQYVAADLARCSIMRAWKHSLQELSPR